MDIFLNKKNKTTYYEKIYFEENKDAAISLHEPIRVLMNASKVLSSDKKEKEVKIDLLPTLAPLTDERCNYNAMIEYVTIRKLKG